MRYGLVTAALPVKAITSLGVVPAAVLGFKVAVANGSAGKRWRSGGIRNPRAAGAEDNVVKGNVTSKAGTSRSLEGYTVLLGRGNDDVGCLHPGSTLCSRPLPDLRTAGTGKREYPLVR